MASLFDKLSSQAKVLGEKANAAAKVLGEKASDTVEITKLSAKIANEKSAIAGFKKDLGEIFWAKFEAGEVSDEKALEVCNKIAEALARINEFQAGIEKLKAPAAEEAPVEAAVETPVEEVAPVVEPEVSEPAVKVCPLCGAQQPADAKVCDICGYEFE